ncbi:MAG TPA: DUF3175 domain-containing protein [Xanthobacteraceae bacterium]|jgi:hypothetical protein|nr:DUF3175 domain-containing protein [Xanthobacteraceae bacterium]
MPARQTAKRATSKAKTSEHSRRRRTSPKSKAKAKAKAKTIAKSSRRSGPHAAKAKKAARGARKWSGKVTETSDALDLKDGLFKGTSTQIAQSLKRAAERSHRRKSTPYHSAMSMLVFYINRAGKNLSATRRKRLETAKDKLRKAFGKPAAA